MDWQPAEKVQKNDAGDFRAFINGAWVPVAKAQKNDAGEYRVMLPDAAPPAKAEPPSNWQVGLEAAKKGLAGLADIPLNASTDIANLTRAQFGALRTAITGNADTLPMYPRDLVSSAAQSAGLVQQLPNMTGGQRMLDAGVQGMVGGALMPAQSGVGMLTNALMGGLGGSAQGAISQGTPASDALGQVAGLAIPGVAGAAVNGTSRLTQNLRLGAKNNFLLGAADGRAPEIVNALRDPNADIVPQVNTEFGRSGPTAGEAAAGVGATKFSAAQKAAAGVLPTEYMDRTSANRVARAVQLETVSGTPEQQAAALAARDTAASSDYGKVWKDSVPGDAELTSMLSRPSMDIALARAAKIAAEKKQPFAIGVDSPAKEVPSAIVDASGAPLRTSTTPATVKTYPAKSLHYVKMALDDIIKSPADYGIGAAEANAIKDTRSEFISWFENKVPGYGTARTNYATNSKIINEQQVGQFLQDALAKSVGEGERPEAFANAMDNAPRTIKSATGQTRFQKLDEALTPKQMDAVNSVRADLERGALFNDQAAAASKSPPSIKTPSSELTSQALGGNTMPGMLSRVTMVANALMRRMQGKIDNKLAIEIATDMLDPAKTANALEGAMVRRSNLSQNSLRNYSGLAPGVTNVLLGSQNALAPQ